MFKIETIICPVYVNLLLLPFCDIFLISCYLAHINPVAIMNYTQRLVLRVEFAYINVLIQMDASLQSIEYNY